MHLSGAGSLSDIPELVGFFSYSRRDDQHSDGALSRLRARIQAELRLQLGRDFRLWQDTAAIPEGSLWEDEIRRAIAESVFFIPIVTPSAVSSGHCRIEFNSFLGRELSLRRNNLIFPILYVRVPALERESEWRNDEVLRVVGTRQYMDWQRYRHRSLSDPEVAEKIERFSQNIVDALRQPWCLPEVGETGSAPSMSSVAMDPLSRAGQDEKPPDLVNSAVPLERANDYPSELKAENIAKLKKLEGAAAHSPPEGQRSDGSTEPTLQRRENEFLNVSPTQKAKWHSIDIVSDGRARLATGAAIFINAAWWCVIFIEAYITNSLDVPFLPTAVILVTVFAIGLLTMYGSKFVRWAAVATLLCGGILGTMLTWKVPSTQLALPIFLGVISCVIGVFVCWSGWRPLQRPLLSPITGIGAGLVLWLLLLPYWPMAVVLAFDHGSLWNLSTSETIATYFFVYFLCLLISLILSKMAPPRELRD